MSDPCSSCASNLRPISLIAFDVSTNSVVQLYECSDCGAKYRLPVRTFSIDTMRMPLWWIKTIVEDLEISDKETRWEFTSRGGNTLLARVFAVRHDDGTGTEVVEFKLNPDGD
jgi:hypothetical protein